MPRVSPYVATFLCLVTLTVLCTAEDGAKKDGRHGHRPQETTGIFNVTVPEHPFDLILCRPENTSVTLSILAYDKLEGFVTYGTGATTVEKKTPAQSFTKGTPLEIVLGPLQPGTRYYYQFHSRPSSATAFSLSPVYSFQTARPINSTFTFTMTADAHLDEHTSPEVYCRTLENIRADKPDFHIDLGNLFMTDKHKSQDEAAGQYVAERYYLGQIACASPLFLALGTHDGESSKYEDGSVDCMAAWSNHLRTSYFPNPLPDPFYSGNNTPGPRGNQLQNYYAWEWGDALFVVLDPFRYSNPQRGAADGWGWSLGDTQFQWLKKTLGHSRARFKFVFIHNLLCGDQAARGGVETASLNEWGGKNADGSNGFKEHRPGWDLPVHQLLVENHVAAVFKAHDNFYARQELDGIAYLMVPQPSFAGNDRIRDLENYGYKQGVFLGNSGHVRVTVSPEKATVEYVRSIVSNDPRETHQNMEVADHCTLPVNQVLIKK